LHDLDSLHQRASAHYLQGNVAAALESWRNLLKLAPGDERAVEGVRLCEHLLAAEGDAGATTPAAAEADPLDDLAALDFKLDLGSDGQIDAQAQEPTRDGAEKDGLDLAWSLEEHSTEEQPEPPPTQTGTPDLAWSLEDPAFEPHEPPAKPDPEKASWTLDEGPPVAETIAEPADAPAETESAAVLELRRRSNELLAAALVSIESGNHDEAVSALDRVLILDEDNEAARSLREKIATGTIDLLDLSQIEASAEPEPDDLPSIELAPLDAAAGAEAAPDIAPLPVTELPDDDLTDQDAAADSQVEGVIDPDDWTDGDADGEAAPGEAPRAAGRNRWIAIGTLAALAAAAFLWFVVFDGGSKPEFDPAATAAAAVAAVDAALAPVAGAAEIGNGTGPPDGAVTVAEIDELQASLDEARAALDAQDFTTAVVAFNRALELDPENPVALEGFQQAGILYKAEREKASRWSEPRQAFEDGDYHNALRLFYRIPDGENPELLRRYKVNGWYNLGVRALGQGDCDTARSNFDDAADVQGDEDGLEDGLRLSHSCRGDEAFLRQVSALTLRGLDD